MIIFLLLLQNCSPARHVHRSSGRIERQGFPGSGGVFRWFPQGMLDKYGHLELCRMYSVLLSIWVLHMLMEGMLCRVGSGSRCRA